MAFEYIEHQADIGLRGIGSTLEEAFAEGAKAMFNVMVELDKIEPLEESTIECEASSIETLFVEFLNKLLAQDKFFSKFEIKIEQAGENYSLNGKAFGETINPEKHEVKTEVKAATYSGIKYEEKEGKHYIQCVVDV